MKFVDEHLCPLFVIRPNSSIGTDCECFGMFGGVVEHLFGTYVNKDGSVVAIGDPIERCVTD